MEDIKYIIKGDTFNGSAKKSDLDSDKKRIRVTTEEGGIKLIVRKNIIYEEEKIEKMKFIDLFSGIGGFHQALTDLGCECNLACDVDKACRETYKINSNKY